MTFFKITTSFCFALCIPLVACLASSLFRFIYALLTIRLASRATFTELRLADIGLTYFTLTIAQWWAKAINFVAQWG